MILRPDFLPDRRFTVKMEALEAQKEGRTETNLVVGDIMGQILEEYVGLDIERDLENQKHFNEFVARAKTNILGENPVEEDEFEDVLTLSKAAGVLERHHLEELMQMVDRVKTGNLSFNGKYLPIATYHLQGETQAYYLEQMPNGSLRVLQTREREVTPASLFDSLDGKNYPERFYAFLYFGVLNRLEERYKPGTDEWNTIDDKLAIWMNDYDIDLKVSQPALIDIKIIINYLPLFYRLLRIPIEYENLVRVTLNFVDKYQEMVERSKLGQRFLEVASPAMMKLLAKRMYFGGESIEVTKSHNGRHEEPAVKKFFKKTIRSFLGDSSEVDHLEENELVELVFQYPLLARAILVSHLDYHARRNMQYGIRVGFTGRGDENEPADEYMDFLEST